MRTKRAAFAIGALSLSMIAPSRAAELDYSSIANLSCKDYIQAYDTDLLQSLEQSITSYLSGGDSDHKSLLGPNLTVYVAIECRLHEDRHIGIAVEDLVSQKKRGQLPALPIGDPALDQRAEALWDAFDKWLHHAGPRPRFRL
jgi:hypothetical protein